MLKITVKTDSSVIVSWLAPQRNFVPITGYTLHIRHKFDGKDQISTDQVEVTGDLLQYVVNDLKPSVYYQFWVVANSLLGQGNASMILGYRVVRSKHNLGKKLAFFVVICCIEGIGELWKIDNAASTNSKWTLCSHLQRSNNIRSNRLLRLRSMLTTYISNMRYDGLIHLS